MYLIQSPSSLTEICWSGLEDNAAGSSTPRASLCSAGQSRHVWEGAALPEGDTGSQAPAQDKNDVLSVGEYMDLIRAYCLITEFILYVRLLPETA